MHRNYPAVIVLKLRLARIEVNCRLKKLANFFKFREVAKHDNSSFFLGEKPQYYFSSRSCKSNSLFGHFDQNGRNSAPLRRLSLRNFSSCVNNGEGRLSPAVHHHHHHHHIFITLRFFRVVYAANISEHLHTQP